MNPEDEVREQALAAIYCKQRLFPALDEFRIAHGLKIDMDAAAFCMMTSRLFSRGAEKEMLINFINILKQAYDKNSVSIEEIIVTPESVDISTQNTAEIITFTPKNKNKPPQA